MSTISRLRQKSKDCFRNPRKKKQYLADSNSSCCAVALKGRLTKLRYFVNIRATIIRLYATREKLPLYSTDVSTLKILHWKW